MRKRTQTGLELSRGVVTEAPDWLPWQEEKQRRLSESVSQNSVTHAYRPPDGYLYLLAAYDPGALVREEFAKDPSTGLLGTREVYLEPYEVVVTALIIAGRSNGDAYLRALPGGRGYNANGLKELDLITDTVLIKTAGFTACLGGLSPTFASRENTLSLPAIERIPIAAELPADLLVTVAA